LPAIIYNYCYAYSQIPVNLYYHNVSNAKKYKIDVLWEKKQKL
jgi:hypothetical protein